MFRRSILLVCALNFACGEETLAPRDEGPVAIGDDSEAEIVGGLLFQL